MMRVLTVANLMFTIVMLATAAKAEVPRELGYGSRAGMAVTVTSSHGIDTSNAVIVGRHTEKNARDFCVQYSLDRSQACVDKYLRELKLRSFITADCNRGTFTTFHGQNYMFVGKHNKVSDDIFMMVDYDIIDISKNEVLDGSSASGYPYVLGQFKALCPKRAR